MIFNKYNSISLKFNSSNDSVRFDTSSYRSKQSHMGYINAPVVIFI